MFAAIAAGTPGPANALVTATGAAVGITRGIPCLLGVSIGTGALLCAVVLGLRMLVLSVPALLLAMNVAGTALLLWLSWQIANAPPPAAAEHHEPAEHVLVVLKAGCEKLITGRLSSEDCLQLRAGLAMFQSYDRRVEAPQHYLSDCLLIPLRDNSQTQQIAS